MPAEPITTPPVDALEQGTRLLDVARIIFPEHDLLKKLKSELILAKKAGLRRFWMDNGPSALMRDIFAYNQIICDQCHCPTCENPAGELTLFHHHHCKLWDKFTWKLLHVGLTYVCPSVEEGKLLLYGPDFTMLYMSLVVNGDLILPQSMWPKEPLQSFHPTADPAFDPETACEFLSPVSDIDAHIVFKSKGNCFDFTFGRKLWAQHDLSPNNIEIAKLDQLRVKLRLF
jgi:hypothetical protein